MRFVDRNRIISFSHHRKVERYANLGHSKERELAVTRSLSVEIIELHKRPYFCKLA